MQKEQQKSIEGGSSRSGSQQTTPPSSDEEGEQIQIKVTKASPNDSIGRGEVRISRRDSDIKPRKKNKRKMTTIMAAIENAFEDAAENRQRRRTILVEGSGKKGRQSSNYRSPENNQRIIDMHSDITKLSANMQTLIQMFYNFQQDLKVIKGTSSPIIPVHFDH